VTTLLHSFTNLFLALYSSIQHHAIILPALCSRTSVTEFSPFFTVLSDWWSLMLWRGCAQSFICTVYVYAAFIYVIILLPYVCNILRIFLVQVTVLYAKSSSNVSHIYKEKFSLLLHVKLQ